MTVVQGVRRYARQKQFSIMEIQGVQRQRVVAVADTNHKSRGDASNVWRVSFLNT